MLDQATIGTTLPSEHFAVEGDVYHTDLVLEPLDIQGRQRIGLWDLARMSVASLWGNKIRTILTILGIIIGVTAVIALLAIGEGVRIWITSSFASSGTNTLTVMRGDFSMKDVAAIEAFGLPIDVVAPQYTGNATVVTSSADESSTISGVTTAYLQSQDLTMAQGSFITQQHNDEVALVTVLGSSLAEDLFNGGQAYGQQVRINGQTFQVIGVLEEKGGGMGGSVDEQALVPISVAHRRLFGGRTSDGNAYLVSTMEIVVTDRDDLSMVKTQVEKLLRERHHMAANGSDDNFRIFNQAAMLEQLNGILSALTIFLVSVAGLSLLVGGLGIMNIMLVSVTERTREIGLRKSIGAHRSDILMQFLIEALLLSLLGGFIGLALGVGIAGIVSLLSPITAPVSVWSVVISIGFSAAVGIFFGIYPAQRAAMLDPIEALRYQ